MATVICGSLAFDTIMTFEGRFADQILPDGEREHVPGVVATEVVEPTGCGDAWRGALLFGLEKGWPLAQCAELGNKVGAIKIAQRGPQNYEIDRKALGV